MSKTNPDPAVSAATSASSACQMRNLNQDGPRATRERRGRAGPRPRSQRPGGGDQSTPVPAASAPDARLAAGTSRIRPDRERAQLETYDLSEPGHTRCHAPGPTRIWGHIGDTRRFCRLGRSPEQARLPGTFSEPASGLEPETFSLQVTFAGFGWMRLVDVSPANWREPPRLRGRRLRVFAGVALPNCCP